MKDRERTIATEPGADAPVRRLRALAHLLDDSIPVPGTGFRFGLDALIGLIPGIGDTAGAAVSGYVLLEGARMGVSRATLLRMAGNVAIEAAIGTIPLLGDLFDAGWKANLRNLKLIEAHLASPTDVRRASRGWVTGIVVVVIAILIAAGLIASWLVYLLIRAIT